MTFSLPLFLWKGKENAVKSLGEFFSIQIQISLVYVVHSLQFTFHIVLTACCIYSMRKNDKNPQNFEFFWFLLLISILSL